MNSTESTYGIVGGGAIGQALGLALTTANKTVLFWDQDKAKSTTESIDNLVEQSTILILAVPSSAVRSVLGTISVLINPNHVVLTLAKGVEAGFITMEKVLLDELPASTPYGLVYGPMLAEEISSNQSGYGVLAASCDNTSTATLIKDFAAGNIHLQYSSDIESVAVCGTLKNIYAMALGVIDGLKVGANTKAMFTAECVDEMRRIIHKLGLNEHVAYDACGLADLLATGWSRSSRNRKIGQSLVNSKQPIMEGEGLNSLAELSKHTPLDSFVIAQTLHQIINAKASAEQILDHVR